MTKLTSTKVVFWALFLILVSHVFVIWYNLYYYWWALDVIQHAIGGVWVAAFFFWVRNRYVPDFGKGIPIWFYIILVVGIVMLVGVGWEWAEYILDKLFFESRFTFRIQEGLPDTMEDLLMDFIGGTALASYVIWREKRK